MSDTTNTAESGAGAVAPADTQQQTPNPAADAPQEQPTPEQQEAEKAERERKEGEKKNRTREYIGRLQNDNAELRRRLADLETRSQPRTQQQASPNPQAQGDRRPTLEDYGYDFNAWQQADTQWVGQQAERRAAEMFDQRAQQAREQELWHSFGMREAEYAEEHGDYVDAVRNMPQLPQPQLTAIMSHPDGPAVAHHLATNPSDFAQFAAMPPQYTDWAVGQIAARLGSAPASQTTAPPPAPKPITNAPPPAPTVGGRAATGPKDPDRMTTDEWLTWRNAQLKKRG